MAGYTRQSTGSIINGSPITAPPLNAEFNQIAAAFNNASGHNHTGGTGDAPKINLATSVTGFLPAENGGLGGKNNFTATSNPLTTNDSGEGYAPGSMWENTTTGRIYICVGNTANAAVWRELVQVQTANKIIPETTDTVDLGEPSKRFQDLWLSGGLSAVGNASIGGTATLGVLNVTGASTLTGIATITNVDINSGTIDGATIGNSTPATAAFTTVSASGGVIANLTGNVVGNVTGNLSGGNVTGDVTGNLTGNVTSTGSSTFNNVTIDGTLNMNAGTTATITNLSAPTNPNDAARKVDVDNAVSNLVDSAPGALDTLNELAEALGDDPDFATTITNSIATKLPKAGGTMSGEIAMGSSKITGVGDPTAAQDVSSKAYTDQQDALQVTKSGDSMSGNLAMGSNNITGLAAPTSNDHATNKLYVDGILGSGASAATNAAAAATSATNAATSAANASTSESNAASSASSASSSATTSSNASSAATTSASNASTSETNASTSETNAASSATNSASSATAAATSETNAATSETNAATSETNAASSATAAASSASAASTSATSASNAQTAAEAARDATLTAYDNFDDRYLGAKSSTPTVDNDGNALVAGSLFFDTVSGSMKVYTGSSWVAAYVSGTDYLPFSGGTMTGDVAHGDNVRATFGAGSDLEVYHNGSASYIEEKGTGSLYIKGTQLRMQATDGTTYLEANDGGAVTLKHSGTTVFNTTSSGINVTGKIIVAGGGSSTFDNVVEIRHDTNDTRILFNRTDTGSNAWVGIPSWDSDAFKIYGPTASGSEPAANYTNQGWSLYGGGSVRLATTSAGINVTGNVGLSGSVDFGDWTITESGGSLYFATGGTNKMKLDASGNLQVAGSVDANATIS